MVRCIAALLQFHVKNKIMGNVHLKFNQIRTNCQYEEKKKRRKEAAHANQAGESA
jgi:hypothetical protein